MNALLAPLSELGEFEQMKRELTKEKGKLSISGCVDSQKLHMIFGVGEAFPIKLIVTYSDLRAKEILDDCRYLCG